ncbi:MAG: hypothetical protein WC936_06385 [Candidatus Nanoarchaeia archaeon]|jgi:hypothetical protein
MTSKEQILTPFGYALIIAVVIFTLILVASSGCISTDKVSTTYTLHPEYANTVQDGGFILTFFEDSTAVLVIMDGADIGSMYGNYVRDGNLITVKTTVCRENGKTFEYEQVYTFELINDTRGRLKIGNRNLLLSV